MDISSIDGLTAKMISDADLTSDIIFKNLTDKTFILETCYSAYFDFVMGSEEMVQPLEKIIQYIRQDDRHYDWTYDDSKKAHPRATADIYWKCLMYLMDTGIWQMHIPIGLLTSPPDYPLYMKLSDNGCTFST